ncbi:MAG: hypothetical protein LBT59_21255 [Clostridiales bacterium]|nr:hypothetical protein [Clostridiales bacterium]
MDKKKDRMSNAALDKMQKTVEEMLNDGKTVLEIQNEKGWTLVQIKNCITRAALAGKRIEPAQHVTVYARSLPKAVQTLYAASPETLFKFEVPDNGEGIVSIVSKSVPAGQAEA